MWKWLFVAAVPLACSAQIVPTRYTLTQTSSFGPPATDTIMRDGNKVVRDHTGGANIRSYIDLGTHATFDWDPADAPAGCSAGQFSGDWGDPFAMSDGFMKEMAGKPRHDAGTQVIAGITAQITEVDTPEGKARLSIDPATALLLKLEIGGKTLLEVKAYSTAKPPASAFVIPPNCAPTAAPAPAPSNPDFVDAMHAPAQPSTATCAVIFRILRAGTFEPVTGLQVFADGGSGLHQLTRPYRIDNPPAQIDIQVHFPDGGESAALIHRQCFGPRTVLLLLLKNPAKATDGAEWVWAKSGKLSQ